MFLSREAIKYVVVRKFGMDDIFILLATVLYPTPKISQGYG